MEGTIQYLLKILSFYTLVMTNILSLPFFNVFIFAFNCKQSIPAFSNIECYAGSHIFHMVFSALDLLIWTFFTLLFIFFFNECNPLSDNPFAGPISKLAFYKFLIKVLIVFYFFIDVEVIFIFIKINKFNFFSKKASFSKEFITLILILYILLLGVRYSMIPLYNKKVHNTVIVCEVGLFWITFFAFVQAVFLFLF